MLYPSNNAYPHGFKGSTTLREMLEALEGMLATLEIVRGERWEVNAGHVNDKPTPTKPDIPPPPEANKKWLSGFALHKSTMSIALTMDVTGHRGG